MNLGKKIIDLRKKENMSQEELAEKIGVTRQTISKWELEETSPDIKQAKKISKIFNISLDELTNNDINSILIEKVSNTEKLAGLIIKILKIMGIVLIVYFAINVVAVIFFRVDAPKIEGSVSTICTINDKTYQIEFDTNKNFYCDNCDDKMNNDITSIIDFENIENSMNNIESYFKKNKGICE
jgi:transcriptional regulator with XRE-family HTH domain